MKIGRFKKGNFVFFGLVSKNGQIQKISSPFESLEIEFCEKVFTSDEVKILPPCVPTKIIAVGLNYRSHAEELNMEIPREPIIFFKPTSAIIGHLDYIVLPQISKEVHYEGELGVIIKKTLYRPKTFKEIETAILGYTCFNDVTARDLQKRDKQWTRSKSFNTFAPFGPWIETDIDPENATVITRVNREEKQRGNTKDLIFSIFDLIKFISNIMTLFPGDIIATGTPPGVGPIKAGDIVEVEIEGIGILKNPVREEDER